MRSPTFHSGTAVLALAGALAGAAFARPARASGFLLYDLSAEAIGRASAVTASVNEPAAVWFNPAALAFMRGQSAQGGGILVLTQSRFSPAGGGPSTAAEPGRFFLPTVYGSAALGDRFAAGVGVFTAFGLGITWPDGWIGRESTIAASLKTVTVNPNLALRIRNDLAVAAGFDAVRSVVDFTNGLPDPIGGTARVAGATWGHGANLAVLYRPRPDRLHFALCWRSRVKLAFDGRADFAPAHPEFDRDLPDQGGTASLTLPDIIAAGVMWRPAPAFALTFDPNLVLWRTYDKLALDFDSAPDLVMRRDNHDAVTLRAGVDWAAAAVPGLHLRGGLIFDQNPSPSRTLSPSLPDADRLDASLGIGWERGPVKVDLGYMLAYFLPSESITGQEGPQGTYRSVSHLFGVSVGVSHGR